MSFSDNLQVLRKRNNMRQEQLAEQLEVSRQAVSKWESGQSYPEMEKLFIICDMFHCDMDSLVKGDLTLEDQADAAGYDRFMNGFSCRITGSITLILAAVTLMAFLDGLVHEDILAVFLIAAAGVAVAVMIVSGINKEAFEKKYPHIQDFYSEEERSGFTRRFGIAIAAAVCLILFGICVNIAVDSMSFPLKEQLSGGFFLVCITVAVGMFVYFGLQKEKYEVEEYNKRHDGSREKGNAIVGKASGVIMLLATAVFLYFGLVWDMFRSAWIVYPIGGILCAVVAVIWGDKKG